MIVVVTYAGHDANAAGNLKAKEDELLRMLIKDLERFVNIMFLGWQQMKNRFQIRTTAVNYGGLMKIISMNLRRAANGKLRPDMAEPTTAAQAKTYSEAMKTADQANSVLDQFTQAAIDFRKTDNSEKDLNRAEGVVATYGPSRTRESRDALQKSRILYFDPSSSQTKSYDSIVEGTVYRSTSMGGGTPGRNYALKETVSLTNGPLLDLRTELLVSIPDDSSRFIKSTSSLRETSSGVLVYEVNKEEQNLFKE